MIQELRLHLLLMQYVVIGILKRGLLWAACLTDHKVSHGLIEVSGCILGHCNINRWSNHNVPFS